MWSPWAGRPFSLTSCGAVTSETAWSGSGGGVSQYEAKPGYQNSANPYATRGIPDVSYDADPNTGFAVYDSIRYQGQSGWFQVGGTSAGAPQWAAIIAVSDQLRAVSGLGRLSGGGFQAASIVYGLPASTLYDVTAGSNGPCGGVCTASSGYDFVTGLGSPRHGIDAALAGSAVAPTATATPSGPTSTPTSTSTSGPATMTPTATATVCPPGQNERGAC